MFRNANRFLIYIVVGAGIYLIVGFVIVCSRWRSLWANSESFLNGLSINFITDAVLLLLVGGIAIVAQFYSERGDVLKQRLRRLFGTNTVSLPVIDYFETIARENAVYAELAEHRIEVLEFREDIFAYRAAFQNRYVLRNAFGDIKYDAHIGIEVAPDLIHDTVNPLAMATRLSLSRRNRTEEFIEAPTPITRLGFSKPIRVTVDAGEQAVLELRWWSWVDARAGHGSGFSLKRFSEKFSVVVVNKSIEAVRLQRSRGDEPVTLAFDQEVVVSEAIRVPPRTRVEFFWLPPAGHQPPSQEAASQAPADLLDFDKRLGEPKIETGTVANTAMGGGGTESA